MEVEFVMWVFHRHSDCSINFPFLFYFVSVSINVLIHMRSNKVTVQLRLLFHYV